jgi:hypothetical protein
MCHARLADLQLAGQLIPASVISERTTVVQIADGIAHAVLWEEINGRTSLVPRFPKTSTSARRRGRGAMEAYASPCQHARDLVSLATRYILF